jgi:hypothetical protein
MPIICRKMLERMFAKTRSRAFVACCVSLSLLVTVSANAAERLSYGDLVNRMIDLERLATLPAPGETSVIWGSGDRASKFDEAAGKYVFWPANGNDGWDCIRMEGDRMVVAEMEGPGVIWRIWSANPGVGAMKIYLDGAETPVVDLPFADYFGANKPPFDLPELSYLTRADGERYLQGKNVYLPIPYQKSCKILADPKWGDFYQFTYTTFPKGTVAPTFTGKFSAEDASALKRLSDFLRGGMGTDPAGKRNGEEVVSSTVEPRAGETAQVASLTGERAITAIRVKTALKDRADQMEALRKLVLRITWDDQAKPAVWCPLGDFFGTAPGENHYRSLLAGMAEDGYYAFWYMPFAKGARVELLNEGNTPRKVTFSITHAPLTRPIGELARFHCKWHRDVFPLPEERWPDWTVMRSEGRGRFCGFMLHVWNPHGGWWGEGDEKFFVDGEKLPSTFGTGSEDYFGYAWGNPELFTRPFHAQTINAKNNVGHISNVRWQVADNVPFQKSFEATIEKYDHVGPGVKYAATAYWYLDANGTDPHEPAPAAERVGYDTSPPPIPKDVYGSYRVTRVTGGSVRTEAMGWYPYAGWRNNDQLLWTGGKAGDQLDFVLQVPATDTYKLSAILSRAKNYGVVQLSLDGKPLGGPLTMFQDKDDRTGLWKITRENYPLGESKLTAGEHTVTVEILGTHKETGVGLDAIDLQPVSAMSK